MRISSAFSRIRLTQKDLDVRTRKDVDPNQTILFKGVDQPNPYDDPAYVEAMGGMPDALGNIEGTVETGQSREDLVKQAENKGLKTTFFPADPEAMQAGIPPDVNVDYSYIEALGGYPDGSGNIVPVGDTATDLQQEYDADYPE